MPGIDYSQRYRDYARFTPAISEMYVRYVNAEKPKREPPIPREELNFFNPNTSLFYLPNALYSAGQAAKSSGIAERKDMVTGRDRGPTTVLGDSGGFQIQTGAIKFEGDKTRDRMMRWMEANCDWSMILDFPTGGIQIGNIDRHLERLESVTGFLQAIKKHDDGTVEYLENLDKTPLWETVQSPDFGNKQALDDLIIKNGQDVTDKNVRLFYACMLQTMINNDYFVANRVPGATKFLNVVQGRDRHESKNWYENVKHYPFEGWSLASHHKENFEMSLGRILDMRDDGLLTDRDWMHFLGVGKFQHGCVYTTIQREVRKQVNENFTISYDVSSPFTLAAYGKVFLGYNLNKDSWSIQGEKLDGRNFLPTNTYMGKLNEDDEHEVEMIGHEMLGTGKGRVKYLLDAHGDKIPLPPKGKDADRPFLDVLEEMFHERLDGVDGSRFVRTQIGEQLKMGDICVNVDPKFTSTWDVVTYAMLMNHNVQVHLEGVYESQDLYDKSDPSLPCYDAEAKHQVPDKLRELREVIKEAFTIENHHDFLNKHQSILTHLASDNASRGTLVLKDFHYPDIKVHNGVVKKKRIADKQAMTPKESVPVDDGLFSW
jgi:hypothetical protein